MSASLPLPLDAAPVAATVYRDQYRRSYAFDDELRFSSLPLFAYSSVYEADPRRGAPAHLQDRPLALLTTPDAPQLLKVEKLDKKGVVRTEIDRKRRLVPGTVGVMCVRSGELLHGRAGWWALGSGGALFQRERVLLRRGNATRPSKLWSETRPPRSVLRVLYVTASLERWCAWWRDDADPEKTPQAERCYAAALLWCGPRGGMIASARRVAKDCGVRVVDLDAEGVSHG